MRTAAMMPAAMLPVALALAMWATQAVAADEALDVADLARALETTISSETANLGAQVTMEAPAAGIDPTVIMDVTGQIAFGAELRGWLEGEMLQVGTFAFVMEGGDMYLRGDLVDSLLEAGEWLYVDASDPAPGFEELQSGFEVGSDAALALYWLLGADGPIVVLGSESTAGTRVTHIEVPIDLELVRDRLPGWLLPAYEANLAGLQEAGADVDRAEAWLGDDGYIGRLRYDMPFSVGDQQGLLRVSYDFSGFGEPIEPRVPDQVNVVDAWELVAAE